MQHHVTAVAADWLRCKGRQVAHPCTARASVHRPVLDGGLQTWKAGMSGPHVRSCEAARTVDLFPTADG